MTLTALLHSQSFEVDFLFSSLFIAQKSLCLSLLPHHTTIISGNVNFMVSFIVEKTCVSHTYHAE